MSDSLVYISSTLSLIRSSPFWLESLNINRTLTGLLARRTPMMTRKGYTATSNTESHSAGVSYYRTYFNSTSIFSFSTSSCVLQMKTKAKVKTRYTMRSCSRTYRALYSSATSRCSTRYWRHRSLMARESANLRLCRVSSTYICTLSQMSSLASTWTLASTQGSSRNQETPPSIWLWKR